MNVYVEYVILDNLVIDSLILWAAAVTLRLPYKKYRVALGGVVGAACAVVSVFVGGWYIYLFKTFCLVSMCVTAVGFGKKLFWYILLTVAYTFVLGGAIIGVFNLFHVSYLTPNGEFYQMRVPLFVYVLAVATTAFLCYSVVFYIKQAKKTSAYITEAVVDLDKKYNVAGFCDSGNTLTCDGIPVCFVTKNFGNFSEYFAAQTLLGKTRAIEVTTVAGTKKVTAIESSVSANGKTLKVYLALPAEKCKTAYNVILSNEFIDR